MKVVISLMVLAIIAMVNCYERNRNATLLEEGNRKFTAKMFQAVANANPDKSFVMSAYSVLTPLAQLSLAVSEGDTHDELLSAIGLPNDEATKSAFSQRKNQIRSVQDVHLKMVNKIYVAKGFSINHDYEHMLRHIFNSSLKNVDFAENNRAAAEINAWVEEHTNHRIKNLIERESLTEDTKLVLVNTLYFKGYWAVPFDKSSTMDRDFYVTKKTTIKVPTMYRVGIYTYGESIDLEAQLLQIPYKGGDFGFYIILPNNVEGITELQEKLQDPSALDEAIMNMFDVAVHVYIPKFKIETRINLKDILPKVGVEGIFHAGKANLTKITSSPSQLSVSEAVQKTFIQIDEEGTEAAAANDVTLLMTAMFTNVNFIADHPFVFLIKSLDNIIFSGVYHP